MNKRNENVNKRNDKRRRGTTKCICSVQSTASAFHRPLLLLFLCTKNRGIDFTRTTMSLGSKHLNTFPSLRDLISSPTASIMQTKSYRKRHRGSPRIVWHLLRWTRAPTRTSPSSRGITLFSPTGEIIRRSGNRSRRGMQFATSLFLGGSV